MPELRTLHGRYKDQGLVLIGVHCDEDLKGRDDVVKSNKLDYAICQDKGEATQDAYDIDGYPTTFVIDRKGVIAAVNPDDLESVIKKELARK